MIILIIVGLFGSLLYISYLPFKKRLLKSGKLTDKLNRQINWSYILLLCLIIIFLFSIRNFRTSSKDRLERISNIQLPADYKVLKDEYQDMWQDYCIIYELQFDDKTINELISNIKTSKYYNQQTNPNEMYQDSLFNRNNEKAVWNKSDSGFSFNCYKGYTNYSIDLDTMTNILKYIECAD
jgi:hypothetical protein